VKKPKKQN